VEDEEARPIEAAGDARASESPKSSPYQSDPVPALAGDGHADPADHAETSYPADPAYPADHAETALSVVETADPAETAVPSVVGDTEQQAVAVQTEAKQPCESETLPPRPNPTLCRALKTGLGVLDLDDDDLPFGPIGGWLAANLPSTPSTSLPAAAGVAEPHSPPLLALPAPIPRPPTPEDIALAQSALSSNVASPAKQSPAIFSAHPITISGALAVPRWSSPLTPLAPVVLFSSSDEEPAAPSAQEPPVDLMHVCLQAANNESPADEAPAAPSVQDPPVDLMHACMQAASNVQRPDETSEDWNATAVGGFILAL
jgi:hypothetical protein